MSMPDPAPWSQVDLAAGCFFNALLRESDHWYFAQEASARIAVVPVDGAGHPHERNLVPLCPYCHRRVHGKE